MRVALLGPLEVTDGGRPLEVGGARLRTLLTLLALDAGRMVGTERLIDGVWGDAPPAGAANALQTLVSRLRRTLPGLTIESRPAGYRLSVDGIDIEDFARLTAEGHAALASDPAGAERVLAEALALWRGPALADVADAEFAAGHLTRLAEQRLAAIEDHIEARLALGRADVGELRALVTDEPLRERLRGQYMRALYAEGRQAEALAAYEDARRTLADRLGVDPSPELEQIYLGVLRRDLTRPAGPATPSSLPAALTSFIGRDDDLKRVVKLARDNRLVTLTGHGGAGKTRLSVEAGRQFESADGVHLVELAPVTDPAEIPHAVLAVLGVRERVLGHGREQAADPVERLVGALAPQRTLLLLDNCEHLIEDVAALTGRLLADCPGLHVLATSREPLGITGETLWPVEPLPLPPAGTGEPLAYASVRLLADRAAAVRPGFEVTEANAAAVVRICRSLDGMPLAIELAAARLRALSPEQVAGRLGDRFRLLTAGSRTALPRHRTLRAVVEWSWDLLDEAEQRLWRRLSVFAGGATVDSAEQICGGDTLDLLTGLVDKSLVVVAGERYRMLETIRAYGAERLAEAGEEQAVRRAHAEYFRDLAETAEPMLYGREQLVWFDRLAAEHDNLHTALRWAIDSGHTETAVRMCGGLGWYWWIRGHRTEGGELAIESLAMPGDAPPTSRALAALGGALNSAGGRRGLAETFRLFRTARDITETSEDARADPRLRITPVVALWFESFGEPEGALELLDPLLADPHPWTRAFAHLVYVQARINNGWPADGEDHLELAITGFREVGDRWGLAYALNSGTELASMRGDPATAARLVRESIGLLTELGNDEDISHLSTELAASLWELGEAREARALLAEALREAERAGSADGKAVAYYQLGKFAWHEGDLAEARVLLTRAVSTADEGHGPPQWRAISKSAMGCLLASEGDLTAARSMHADALVEALASGDRPIIAQALTGLAHLAALSDDPDQAALLLGVADEMSGMPNTSRSDLISLRNDITTTLGDQAQGPAYQNGRQTDLDDILHLLQIQRPPPYSETLKQHLQ